MCLRALGFLIVAVQAMWALTAPAATAQDRPTAASDPAGREVIAAVPKNWPPQYSLDAAGKPTGFAIDVMNEIAARAGLRVTYRVLEYFPEIEEAMKSGGADVVPNYGIAPYREKFISFTSPVETFAIVIFVREQTQAIRGLEDLKGRRVGVVAANVGVKLLAAHQEIQSIVHPGPESALFELLAGHLDAVVYPKPVMLYLARNAGIEGRIKVVGEPLAEIKRAIGVRKDRPELLTALDKAVTDFVGTLEYRRIYAKWYGRPMPYWTGQRIAWAMGGVLAALLIIIALWRYRLMVQMNRRFAASEEKFRDLIEGAVPGVLIHRDFKPLFVNRSYARLLGYDAPEELLRQASVLDHVAPQERARLDGYAAARMRGDEAPAVYEYQGIRKDGTVIWLENRARAVDWEGAPAIQSTVVDVTEKRQAEAELMLRSSQQAVVAELGQQALMEKNMTVFLHTAVNLVTKILGTEFGKILELRPNGKELILRAGVGWKPGLVGRAIVPTDKNSQAGFTLLNRAPVAVSDLRTETRFKGPQLLLDHSIVSGLSVTIGDPDRPYGVLGVHMRTPRVFSEDDALFLKTVAVMLSAAVSRRRADRALRASDDRLRGAIESMQEGFALYDADDRLVMINDVFRRINPNAQAFLEKGATFEDMIRSNVKGGMLADAVGREEEFIRERLAQHRDPKRPIVRRFSNGNWYIIKETRTPEGGMALTFTDVTELKRAEEALRDSREQFRSVVEASPSTITLKGRNGRFMLVNRAFADWMGMKSEEIVGRTIDELFPDQHQEFTAQDRGIYETGAIATSEMTVRYGDGKSRDVLLTKGPVHSAAGDIVAVCTIVTDISKRKQEEQKLAELQAELAHVSRVSTMGEMAAGLAHELNQPLTAITNYAKGTLRRLHTGGADSVDLLPIMELVAEQALRAGEIIRKIRGFMNRSEPQKSRIDLHKAIDEVMSLLAGEIHMTGIEVAVELPKTLPAVLADSIQIQQVLLNLIRNAVAAMGNNGSKLNRLEIGAKANGADAVEVYVKDNGPGIPADVEERLFEPFFTTKTDGLGMGLSISRSIIVGHEGRIWASSETGKGASFHFTLPTGASIDHDAA